MSPDPWYPFDPFDPFLGRFADIGHKRELDESKDDIDVVKLAFRSIEDLHHGDLSEFLREHISRLDGVTS